MAGKGEGHWFWLVLPWSLDQPGPEEKEHVGRAADTSLRGESFGNRKIQFFLFCFQWRIKIVLWVVDFRNLFPIESTSPGVCTVTSVAGPFLRSSQMNCYLAAEEVGRRVWFKSAVIMWRRWMGEDAVHLTTLAALWWVGIYPLNPNTNLGRGQGRKLELFKHHSPYGL